MKDDARKVAFEFIAWVASDDDGHDTCMFFGKPFKCKGTYEAQNYTFIYLINHSSKRYVEPGECIKYKVTLSEDYTYLTDFYFETYCLNKIDPVIDVKTFPGGDLIDKVGLDYRVPSFIKDHLKPNNKYYLNLEKYEG